MTDADLVVSIDQAVPPLRVEHRFVAGRTTAVVGPNGAGKSTMLRVIAGLFRGAGASRIRLGDEVFRDGRVFVPPHRRGIALLSQDARLFPHLTVAENVAFAPSAQRMSRAEVRERVARWVEAVEVAELVDRKPDELSGGQAQRVAIARALAAEPRILLLDEPFRALDVDVASRLRALLRVLLADHGRTTIMVTHDPVDALGLAEDIVVLDRGRIVESGSTSAVLTNPGSRFSASLSGLNLFVGRIDEASTVVDESGNRVVGTVGEDVPAGGLGAGTPAAATFSPRAVAVYLEAPHGSPRTMLRATVRDVVPRGDHAVVSTDVGGQVVAAEVTWAAVADLGLVTGIEVVLVVKASEVRVSPVAVA
ncbi:sulfate/molybdate ABC transporter ATP-binding protein [Gordonia amicalis]|uniref:sulfate/molybdate ABC transporter ATP-binding protein n=1 Tax=Gordonia amicalis TaxID=89053 RepID=UPI0002A625D0|nr:ATP-binding cassette domain-containing protein [Gordonia amicalis]MBA5848093.1 ATP-binding cassette domain-containing protein [Gordonia amicalis]MDV7172592.1 ATP-binding cassette domain-containing protein [Gordonia amicalis]NKX76179.1 ATP-binding cassette domain-containing protein [Gordonia amicalis]UKO92206.1 ATP-binding cassette domain-containing protein [Gordonia amicalis]GAC53595.1 molybdate ABC transporter ATP-binding protein [Gordonia amicalis NBRC 100051 = JCM 11271]